MADPNPERRVAEFTGGPKDGVRILLPDSLGGVAPDSYNFADGSNLTTYQLRSVCGEVAQYDYVFRWR